MEIKELYVKNFGKFSDRHFLIEDGIHIIYGENEYGKSTLYAFIKAMLFGMERGRGRAALNDDFSRYQPWENPNYYAGILRFTSGGKCFRLERNFDRYARSASLICEEDGEELSVEDGDLEMLLSGMSRESFENTVAIGQLMARPGQGLAEELNNYAANYYETGSSNLDLGSALEHLRIQRKAVDQEIKELLARQEAQKDAVRQECKYISGDAQKLQIEMEENQKKLNGLQNELKQLALQENARQDEGAATDRKADSKADKRQGKGSGRDKQSEEAAADSIKGKSYLSMGALGILAGGAGRIWSAFITSESLISGGGAISMLSWLFLIIGTVLIALGVRMQIKSRKADCNQGIRESETAGRQGQEAEKDTLTEQREILHRLQWESQRIKGEWKDKQIRLQNLNEQLLELEIPGERLKNLRIRRQALALAEEKLKEAAKNMAQGFGEILNKKASRILEQITQGRYTTLLADEQLSLTLLEGGRRIPVDRVSLGTIGQVYFAIRMAAAEILYEEPLPVILDDTFAFYDEKRLKSTLKWLREQQRQVLIFTCRPIPF